MPFFYGRRRSDPDWTIDPKRHAYLFLGDFRLRPLPGSYLIHVVRGAAHSAIGHALAERLGIDADHASRDATLHRIRVWITDVDRRYRHRIEISVRVFKKNDAQTRIRIRWEDLEDEFVARERYHPTKSFLCLELKARRRSRCVSIPRG